MEVVLIIVLVVAAMALITGLFRKIGYYEGLLDQVNFLPENERKEYNRIKKVLFPLFTRFR